MRTSTLRTSKAHVSLWKVFAALLLAWICVPTSKVSAQTDGTEKACWVLTKPIVNGNGRGTLTFTYAEGNNLKGKKLLNNKVVDASSAEGDLILDGEPIDANCTPEWTWKQSESGSVGNERIETVVFDESFAKFRPISCKKWFDGCAYLTEIKGIEYLNTENVTDMSHMFYGCTLLKNIDLSHFDTRNVTTMEYMFCNMGVPHDKKSPLCLDLSSFNTSKVENMGHMFAGSWQITTLDLKGFDMNKVTTTDGMFAGCYYLASIYADDWSTNSNITDSKDMFTACGSLKGAKGYTHEGTDGIQMANGQTGYFMPTYKNEGKDTYPAVDINIASYPSGTVSLNLKNKETFEAPYPFFIDKGTYTRENMPSNWGTVCLPFAIDVANTENNCEFYQLDGINGENITVSQITTTIPAGTPVIVKRTSGTDLKIFSPTEYASIVTQPVEETGVNHLVGTFTNQELIKQNCYFIARDKFWQVTAKDAEGNTIKGVYVPPFRASITAAEGETLAQSLGIVIADETNGIGLTPTVEDLLSEKAEYFDLQGRRLDGPQKGINIVRMGGKTRKVVIK